MDARSVGQLSQLTRESRRCLGRQLRQLSYAPLVTIDAGECLFTLLESGILITRAIVRVETVSALGQRKRHKLRPRRLLRG